MLLDIEDIVKTFEISASGVFHVGAHFGQEIERYKRIGLKNIVMFEPSKKTFRVLEENLKGENVTLVNLGLGQEDDELDLYTETENQGMSNSLLKPSLHTAQYPNIKFNSFEKVKITSLDSWCALNPDKSKANLMSLDVQGYEFEVLLGSQKTLDNIDLIICEVNRDELYKDCAYVIEIDTLLSYHGFVRIAANWAGRTWGDAAYLKKSLLKKEQIQIPKIAIKDSSFVHHKSMLGNDSASYLFPTSKFEWERENIDMQDLVVVTDSAVDYVTNRKKIAWLLEPRVICNASYEYAFNRQSEFELIVSHDLEFVKSLKNGVYVPHGGTWIPPYEWKIDTNKSKCVSIIASNKRITEGHRLRHDAAKYIQPHDRFGRGYKAIASKVEALRDYRFTVVIENCNTEGYFSEKLIDSFLCCCVPIYWGSKNVSNFFDSRGIVMIDSIEDLQKFLQESDLKDVYDSMRDSVIANAKKARRFASMDELFLIGLQGIK
jgi:FkbM family methyltransferase